MSKGFVPLQKMGMKYLLSSNDVYKNLELTGKEEQTDEDEEDEGELLYQEYKSQVSMKIPCIRAKLKRGWVLASNAFTDGHRLILTLKKKEIKPATKKQYEAKKELEWKTPNFLKYPDLESIPRNRFELAECLQQLETEFEVVGIDPGVRQVLAWVHNNAPGFYRLEEYRHDFGLDVNQRWRSFLRNKQAQLWTQDGGENYFDTHSQISLKQSDATAMKAAIKKLKLIVTPLFEYYQRGCFNRMNFFLYKKRQKGLEKIARLLTCGRKVNNQRKWTRKQIKEKRKRKEKMKRKWKPIHDAWKEVKKKQEEKKKKKELEEKEEEKKKAKKEKEKPMLPESKRKKRIATLQRKQKRKKMKEFKPREPSMNVDANNYPAPTVDTPRAFLICSQIASLSSNPNAYEQAIKEIKELIEPQVEDEKKKKKKRTKAVEKQIEVKVKKLQQQISQDFMKKKVQLWSKQEEREEAEKLFNQFKKKEQSTNESSSLPMPLKSENEIQVAKRLVVAFGAAKFATRGVPREKIKTFLRSKQIPVYETNEFYTSQKCAECGEVKQKERKEKNQIDFIYWVKKKQTKEGHSRCVYCEKCKKFHNRDANAARNMVTVWNFMTMFRKRPQFLKKKNRITI